MFTGIIEEVGTVVSVFEAGGKRRLVVSCDRVTASLKEGDSIAVSGVCLTAVDITPQSFTADLAEETWNITSFSRIAKKARVNLELPMRANGRFDGHIVQGHVDGTGTLVSLTPIEEAADYRLTISIPVALERFVVAKGSLCIEGISLTVAKLEGSQVSVAIIPHTAENSNLLSLKPRDSVNLEVDVIAKYVEKMMRGPGSRALKVEDLVRQGF